VSARYVLRPKADQDLDQQAYYLATEAGPETGHRFLVAAHETFALLSTQPQMGWPLRLRNPRLASLRVFRISGFDKDARTLHTPLIWSRDRSSNPRLAGPCSLSAARKTVVRISPVSDEYARRHDSHGGAA
jgi:plasmid stabilization system protein ParE